MDTRAWDKEKAKAVAGFAWREERKLLVAGLVVLVLVSFIVLPGCGAQGHTDWWMYAEPISGVLTLALAIIIWIGQLDDRWLASLPKELTAEFYLDGRPLMRCERAYRPCESDIRVWAQQLGSQMATEAGDRKPTFLSFRPDIRHEPPKVEKIEGQYVVSYAVRFNLREAPPNLKGLVERKECIVWRWPEYTYPLE